MSRSLKTLELLTKNGEQVVNTLRDLRDEQLDRTLPGDAPMSAQDLFTGVVLGHLRSHFASIEAALAED